MRTKSIVLATIRRSALVAATCLFGAVVISTVPAPAATNAALVSDTGPTGQYRGVEYQPQCSIIGCVNIIKFCTYNLKNCLLYWNTSVASAYKSATGATLRVTIQVQQRNVSSYTYNKPKNANSVPFFHGTWGIGTPMGKYSYSCYAFATCTGYLQSSDDVEFGGVGEWDRNGLKSITIYGKWAKNTGKVVEWTGGGQKWAGLPPG